MTALGVQRRGVTIPETALTVGFTMLLLFGAVRLTLVAYLQAQSDGAAFIGSHTVAQNPQSSTSNDQSYAAKVVQLVFPNVSSSALSLTTSATSVDTLVTQSTDGLPVPGAPSTISLTSHVTEPIAQATPGTVAAYTFSASAALSNYCPTPATPYTSVTYCGAQPTYQLYTAQTMSAQTNGSQGVNGRFTEWICHSKNYSAVNFPSSRPAGGAGSKWDPNNRNSSEYSIYQWDTGTHQCQ